MIYFDEAEPYAMITSYNIDPEYSVTGMPGYYVDSWGSVVRIDAALLSLSPSMNTKDIHEHVFKMNIIGDLLMIDCYPLHDGSDYDERSI